MRIAIAQIDPVVGAFEANVKKIKEAYRRACSKKADLLLTPEMGVCGYPPHDLMERPEMFDRNERAVEELRNITRGESCVLAVGHVSPNPLEEGRAAQNVVTLLEDGKRVFRQAKVLLPTYDVFDEARYFEPAQEVKLWNWKGHPIAVAICEDFWAHDPSFGRRLYGQDPIDRYREGGAELALSLSSSPYEWGKHERRFNIHGDVARLLKTPLIYVNQVGATDEILFDGGSFALDAQGKLAGRLPLFKTSFGILEVSLKGERHVEELSSIQWESPDAANREDQLPQEIEVLARGLLTGIREYFARTGFKKAILGLSGGIDSAVVGALAVKALGVENVIGVAMPSQYSSHHSCEDAEKLAKSLGISLQTRPIKFLFSTAKRELSPAALGLSTLQGSLAQAAEELAPLAPLAEENLQSRLRGLFLMTLANHHNALVLTTGNKSELATGYCTLYGDMVGALAPIGDLFKTRVYELARFINSAWGNPIPERSLTKAPSAELKPNQTDQDTLPPYADLDAMLEAYIEKSVTVSELEKRFGSWVRETLRRLEINEYKRRQGAPVLKVSLKAFGIGRRIPIAKTWDQ